MNWINFRTRKPINGQRVLVYTDDHEIFYCVYKQENNEFCTGNPIKCCEQYFSNEITHWASPQPPEIDPV